LLLCANLYKADRQYDALIDFFKSTSGNNWKNNNGWASNNDPCAQNRSDTVWYGLTCSGGWVQSIKLSNNAIGGTIPSSIANIPYLQHLDLSSNLLVGTIPGSIVDAQSLNYLNLQHNHLTGSIPSIGNNNTGISNLYLGGNQLQGPIPNSFLNLQGLSQLDLSANRLTGTVNSGLASLSLMSLWINNNALSGQMPLRLCQSLLLCSAAFNANLMCASMSCTCGAMLSCNCNNMCQTSADCRGLCTTCVGASPYENGYCK